MDNSTVLSQPGSTQKQDYVGSYISGLDASRSLMDRADENSRQNAQAKRQQDLYDVTAPLRQVTQQAEMEKAKGDIAGYGIQQDALKQIYSQVPDAIRVFTDIAHLPDLQARAQQSLEALSRFSQMATVPALKSQFDVFNHQAMEFVAQNIAFQKVKAQNDAANRQALTPFSVVNVTDNQGRVHPATVNRSNNQVTPITMEQLTPQQQAASPAPSPLDPSSDASIHPPSATPVVGLSPQEKAAQTETGKVEAKYQQDLQNTKPKRQLALQQAQLSADRAGQDIDEIIRMVDSASAGVGGAILGKFAGTDATNIQEKINSVGGGIMLHALSDMKAASGNGSSGLGQVSNLEGDNIKSQFGALSTRQSPAQLKSELQKVKRRLQENYGIVRGGYQLDYKEAPPDSATVPTFDASKEARLQELRAKLGK